MFIICTQKRMTRSRLPGVVFTVFRIIQIEELDERIKNFHCILIVDHINQAEISFFPSGKKSNLIFKTDKMGISCIFILKIFQKSEIFLEKAKNKQPRKFYNINLNLCDFLIAFEFYLMIKRKYFLTHVSYQNSQKYLLFISKLTGIWSD